jgi:phosphoserine phosphatase RsbU/P
VISNIDEDRLVTVFHLQPRLGARLVLVDTHGLVTFTSDKPVLPFKHRQWRRYDFVAGALRGHEQRVADFASPDGPSLTGAMVPVPRLGWSAGSFIPTEQVIGPVRASAVSDLVITGLVLLLTLIIGSLLAKQMIDPVESLSHAVRRLGNGDLAVRAAIPSTAEFGAFAQTMNSMAESLQQREQELAEAYDRERRIADALQQRMLPEAPFRTGRVELATAYFSALDESELGGDFYDVMSLPDGLIGILVGDVSGKGLEAAVYTASVKYMLEGFAYENHNTATAMRRLNRVMRGSTPDWKFITAFFGVLDPSSGKLSYTSAGHPPPLIRHADGSTEWLDGSTGLPIATDDRPDYTEQRATLVEGDTLLCYTDGAIEVRCDGKWFGTEGLEELMSRTSATPSETVRIVHETVTDFCGGRLPDDIALVAVRFGAAGHRS